MTSPFEFEPTPDSGFSLFEVMVSLAIIALITGVSIAAIRTPSPALVLEKRAADIISKVVAARHNAIRSATAISMEFGDASCAEDTIPTLSLFPDGTATGDTLCLKEGDASLELSINAITGRLARLDTK